MVAAAASVALTLAAETAVADVRTGVVADPAGDQATYDVAEARLTINNATGETAAAVRFHQPIPAQPGVTDGAVIWAGLDAESPCSDTQDLYINFNPDEGSVTVRVGDGSNYADYPMSVSADRREMAASFTEGRLVGKGARCMHGHASAYPQSGIDDFEAPMRPDPAPLPVCSVEEATMRLSGPGAQIAYDRKALVAVVGDGRDYAGGGLLEMFSPLGAPPFFSRSFDAGTERKLREDGAAWFSIELDRGNRPGEVRLQWLQFVGADACRRLSRRAVRGFAGVAPRVRTGRRFGRAELWLTGPGGSCNQVRPGAVRVTVRGAGRTRLTATDACGRWRQRSGHRPGLRVGGTHGALDDGARLRFAPTSGRTSTRRYAVTVQWRGRTLARRTVVARVFHQPDRRVWQGTDAFVNYCINRLKRTWSRGGRLFCWRPGYTNRSTRWR